MSTRLATLPHGVVEQLHRQFASRITAEEAQQLHDNPKLWDPMFQALRTELVPKPEAKQTPRIWTPLNNVIEIARGYEGVTGEDIDRMLKVARDSGLIEGFESESATQPLLAPVIVRNRESVPDTLLSGRALMQKAWAGRCTEWTEAYAQGVDDKRVKLIPGARPFVPHELSLRIVDFGANWDRQRGLKLEDVQKTQTAQLAVFEALFAASQHPEWVRQMDGAEIPYAVMAALLLNVPGSDRWRCSPLVWRVGDEADLHGRHVERQFPYDAMPVLRAYKH